MEKPVSRTNAAAFVPERVGRYEILLPIASGGMATVYLARSRGTGGFEREVALKLTHAHLKDDADFAADLLEEAKIAVRIRHPNVVPVLDVDDDPLGLFLVMDYVEGDTLAGLRRRGTATKERVPRAIGLRILIDALNGLHAAHELRDDDGELIGLVHRDFSPQNILIGIDGIGKLTDFGIAKAASRLGHTRTGVVKGKISYMAPEQAKGQMIDRRCDLWAAGIIAWELVAGRRLYAGESEVGTLLKVVSEQPPRLSTVVPDVPPAIEQCIARALTIEQDTRPATALVFAKELAAACRLTGDLADHEQVADYVNTLAGPKLAERRARVGEIVRLRKKIANVVSPESLKKIEEGIVAARAAMVSIPEAESQSRPIEAHQIELVSAREISGGSIPEVVAPTKVPPAMSQKAPQKGPPKPPPPVSKAPAKPPLPAPKVPAKPAAPPAPRNPAPPVASKDPPAAAEPVEKVSVASLADALEPASALTVKPSATIEDDEPIPAGLEKRDPKKAYMIAGGGAAVLVAIVIALATRKGPGPKLAAAPPPIVPAVSAPVPPATPVERADTSASMAVHANAPVASLRVGDRAISQTTPARALSVDLTGAEHEHGFKLFASAVDGRDAVVLVPANASSVVVEFAAAKASPPTFSVAPVKPAQKPPALAPSPYK